MALQLLSSTRWDPVSTATSEVAEPPRTCTACGDTKAASEFHRKGAGRRRSTCAPCTAIRTKDVPRRLKPPTEQQRRHWFLRSHYRISLEQFNLLLDTQGHACAICGEPPKAGRYLEVDHCHTTGRVRALLCGSCNSKVGAYESIRGFILSAEKYLLVHGGGNELLYRDS